MLGEENALLATFVILSDRPHGPDQDLRRIGAEQIPEQSLNGAPPRTNIRYEQRLISSIFGPNHPYYSLVQRSLPDSHR